MKTFQHIVIILLLLILGCADEEDLKREFPRIATLPVTNITSEGATFSGSILDPGSTPITELGFMWDLSSNPGLDNEQIIIKTISSNFNVHINARLREKVTYYVRAYAKNEAGYIYFGPVVSFVSLGSLGPQLDHFTPDSGTFLDEIKITGKNFSKRFENNKVYFNEQQATVNTDSDSILLVKVPKFLMDEQSVIKVSVVGNVSTFSTPFNLKFPDLKPVKETEILAEDTLMLVFDKLNLFNDVKVDFNGVNAKIVNYQQDTLKVKVPFGIKETPLQLNVKINNYNISQTLTGYKAPKITGFSPKVGNFKDTITVAGQYFNPSLDSEVKVKFNDNLATVVEKGQDYLKFIPPNAWHMEDNIIEVVYFGQSYSFTEPYRFNTSQIEEISSPQVFYGEEFVLRGKNFYPEINITELFIGSIKTDIISLTDSTLTFILPNDLLSTLPQDLYLINNYQEIYRENFLTIREPEIISVDPILAQSGEHVTIMGKGFNPNWLKVYFQEKKWEIIYLDYNQITAKVFDGDYTYLLTQHHQDNLILENGAHTVTIPDFTYSNKGPFTFRKNHTEMKRHSAVSFTFDNKIYFGLGTNSQHVAVKDINYYDPQTDEVAYVTAFPGGKRTGSVAFNVGDHVFIGLGSDGENQFFNDWNEYWVDNDIWHSKATFPGEPRTHAFGWAMNEKIYILGGYSNDNGLGIYYSDFWEYDVKTDSWKQLAPIPENGRRSGFCFGIGNKIYAGSGIYAKPYTTREFINDFWEYDINTNVWTRKQYSPNIAGAKAFVYKGKGYIYSGEEGRYYNSIRVIKSIYSYNSFNDKFELINIPDLPGRSHYSMNMIKEKIYFIGGYSSGNVWNPDPLSDNLEWNLAEYSGY